MTDTVQHLRKVFEQSQGALVDIPFLELLRERSEETVGRLLKGTDGTWGQMGLVWFLGVNSGSTFGVVHILNFTVTATSST